MATQTRDSTREGVSDLSLDTAAVLAEEDHGPIEGRSPWYLAWRRLRRNYVALFSLFVFILIVACCALAPIYAHRIAHTGPNEIHATELVRVNGKDRQVVGGGSYLDPKTNQFVVRGISVLGPTWWHAD